MGSAAGRERRRPGAAGQPDAGGAGRDHRCHRAAPGPTATWTRATADALRAGRQGRLRVDRQSRGSRHQRGRPAGAQRQRPAAGGRDGGDHARPHDRRKGARGAAGVAPRGAKSESCCGSSGPGLAVAVAQLARPCSGWPAPQPGREMNASACSASGPWSAVSIAEHAEVILPVKRLVSGGIAMRGPVFRHFPALPQEGWGFRAADQECRGYAALHPEYGRALPGLGKIKAQALVQRRRHQWRQIVYAADGHDERCRCRVACLPCQRQFNGQMRARRVARKNDGQVPLRGRQGVDDGQWHCLDACSEIAHGDVRGTGDTLPGRH